MPIPEHEHQAGKSPRQLVRDRVYGELKSAILNGVLQPGEKLEEAQLRAWLNVSGTPIRQALHLLTLEGLVQTSPQSRTSVIAPRPDETKEHLQVIGVLMTGMITLAFPHITEPDRAELLDLIDGVLDKLAGSDVPALTRAAQRYYGKVVSLCPNAVLIQLTQQVSAALSYHVNTAYEGLNADWAQLAEDYRALRAAIAGSDRRAAEAATKRIFQLRGA
jgi:DNA-binding GntR family transcriptional regulator